MVFFYDSCLTSAATPVLEIGLGDDVTVGDITVDDVMVDDVILDGVIDDDVAVEQF